MYVVSREKEQIFFAEKLFVAAHRYLGISSHEMWIVDGNVVVALFVGLFQFRLFE